MTLEVAKVVWAEACSLCVRPQKTTCACASGATISDRPDLRVAGKLGSEPVTARFMEWEHETQIRTVSVQETGCGTFQARRYIVKTVSSYKLLI